MSTVRRVAGKLGGLLLTLFLASLLVFFSRFLVPGDPVRFLLRGRKPSPEAIAEVTAQYGLDLPPWQQYLRWIGGVLHGDFGRSLQFRQDVTAVIGDRLPVTLMLVVMAGAIIAVVGLVSGAIAALNKGRAADRGILIGLTVLGAIPSFVGSIVLIAIFSVQLGWFPSFGSGSGLGDTAFHLVLPSIALAIVFIVLVGKVTRSAMVEQLNREHVEVAISRGVTRMAVVLLALLAGGAAAAPAAAGRTLPTPQFTSGSAVDSRTVTLSWTKVKGADHYVVEYAPAMRISTTSTSVRVTDLYPGDAHQFTVRAETRRNVASATSAPLVVPTPVMTLPVALELSVYEKSSKPK